MTTVRPRVAPDVTIFKGSEEAAKTLELRDDSWSSVVYFLSTFNLNLLFQVRQQSTKHVKLTTVEATLKVTITVPKHEGNLENSLKGAPP